MGKRLKQKYGFIADPALPLWKNVERRIGEMNYREFMARPRNRACHNLLRLNGLPAGVHNLLGFGLNYCIQTDTATKTTEKTFDRLRQDVRGIHYLTENPPKENGEESYIPSLYVKSDYEFDPATAEIEKALAGFERAIK